MSDLDDFFKKKDRKKTGKKQDDTLKASDLFKVLDNAAQYGLTEDQEQTRNAKKQLELGPVLSEVVNPEEASKWSEPLDEDEERNYDLSNLKIESLQTTEEDETAALAAAQDESAKSAKGWSVPVQKYVPRTVEIKSGTPGDRKEEPVAATSTVLEVSEKKKIPLDPEPEKKPEVVPEHHGILETMASGLGSVIGTVVGTVSGLLHVDSKAKEESNPTEDAVKKDEVLEAAEGEKKPAAYIPPSMRKAKEEEDAKSAVKAHSAARVSAVPEDKSGSSGGKYVPRHVKEAAEQAERDARLGTASGFQARPSNYKKPELDNEEEFPTLGGKQK